MRSVISIFTLISLLMGGLLGASGGKELCLHEGHLAVVARDGDHGAGHCHDEGLGVTSTDACHHWSIDSQRVDQAIDFDNTHHPVIEQAVHEHGALRLRAVAWARCEPPWVSPPVEAVRTVVLLI